MYQGLVNPSSSPARRARSAGASPYTYTNDSAIPERIIITAGTITLIEVQCDGATFDTIATLTGGWFLLNPGEAIRITWAVITPVLSICPF